LFSGFLFFVDKLYTFHVVAKSILVIFTMVVIIGANIFVVLLIGYDIFVRRKKERKREKKKRKLIKEIKSKEKKQLDNESRFDSIRGMVTEPTPLPEYKFRIFEDASESDEDESSTLNEIFDDLISFERFKKKIVSVQKKGKKYTIKIIESADHISKRKSVGKSVSEKMGQEITELNLQKEEKSRNSKVKRLINLKDSKKNDEIELMDLE
jgi:hypothetical protein